MTRVDLRAEVAGMPPAEALAYVLDYFDMLFPAQGQEWRLEGVHLQRQPARLLRRLWQDRGHVVATEHLLGAMYGDTDEDQWASIHIVRVRVSRLRPVVAKFGGAIRSEWGRGYVLVLPKGRDLPWVAA